LSKSKTHNFTKQNAGSLFLIEGQGVQGDAHRGETVKHRSRVRRDPTQPNLRQVHLIHLELIDQLREQGFGVEAGSMGENITTSGIDLLSLPTGTVLQIGQEAVIEVTGLRNPCAQLDGFQQGLMSAVLDRDENGNLIRKAGIMAIVKQGGLVSKGDAIEVQLPPKPHRPLEPV